MFENITEEQILTRMLARVSSALDKRQGSIIYDSTAPAALEFINMYISLDEALNEAFIDTMSLENLKRKGVEPETYRNRLLAISDSETFGGNKADYVGKVGSINGVGGVKVYSGIEWNGGGTVKVVFTTSSFGVPSQTLIDQVQTKIDPTVNGGEGLGIAPIGHIVTCVGAEAATVDITADFTFSDASYYLESCLSNMKTAIDDYFLELNSDWQNQKNVTVRIADVISSLMDVEGVIDVQNVKLNGVSSNLIVDQDSLVVRGTINEL